MDSDLEEVSRQALRTILVIVIAARAISSLLNNLLIRWTGHLSLLNLSIPEKMI